MQSSEDKVLMYQVKIDNETDWAGENKEKNQLPYWHIFPSLRKGVVLFGEQERKRGVPSLVGQRSQKRNKEALAGTSKDWQ